MTAGRAAAPLSALVLLLGVGTFVVSGKFVSQKHRLEAAMPPSQGGASQVVITKTLRDDPRHVHHPPGSIVGKDTPHLIPADLAQRLMFTAIAGMARGQSRALGFYFASIENETGFNLSDSDRQHIVAAAREYVSQTAATGPNSNSLGQTDAGRAAIAAKVWSELAAALSSDGLRAIHQNVEGRVKRNIVILK